MIVISQKAIDAIKKNSNVKARMMLVFGRSNRSVELWFAKKSLVLTTPDAVKIIHEETGFPENEIIIEETKQG